MAAIIKKEMRTYFTSVTGYGFLAVLLIVMGFYFGINNLDTKRTLFGVTLSSCTMLFMLLIPVLTMRLFSEEARQRTDQLLFTSPLKISYIVIGKFLSAFFLFLIGMGITLLFPLILTFYGKISLSETAAAYIGYILLGACLIAVGVFISSLTESQMTAAVVSMAVLYAFFLLQNIITTLPATRQSSMVFLAAIAAALTFVVYDSTKKKLVAIVFAAACVLAGIIVFIANPALYDDVIRRTLGWFSLLARLSNFFNSVLSLADIVYYVSFAAAFIYLTINGLEKKRWK